MPVVRLFHYAWVAFFAAGLTLLLPYRLLQASVGLAAGLVILTIGFTLALNVRGLLTRLRAETQERDYRMPETGGAIPGWSWRIFSWTLVGVGAFMVVAAAQTLS